MITFTVNGKERTLDIDPATPLLWVLRDTLGLVGAKYGCGIAQCGACTVHVNGGRRPFARVRRPLGEFHRGIRRSPPSKASPAGDKLHPLQQAWIDHDVAQCGYCQAGQIMTAVALLARTPKPTDTDIDSAMSGNLCRCATYNRIRQAIHAAAGGGAL